jgi:hypothetical protein
MTGRGLTVTQPPPRALRPLDRALRVVDAGPRPFFRAALVSLTVTSAATIVLALSVRPAGALPVAQRELISLAVAALGLVGVVEVVSLCWPGLVRAGWLDSFVRSQQRACVWLALTAWFPLLLIAAYFRVLSTEPPSVHWIAFGYDDKRWESCTYLLGALAPAVLLVAVSRVLQVGRGHPATWRSWLAGLVPRASAIELAQRTSRTAWLRAGRCAAGIVTALGLACYFYGPPWYLDQSTARIGYQEDVFLAGLQAISKGYVPYIGPAAEQYGPGAQLLSYLYMRHIGAFSVIGFRESWAVFQWAGASILFEAFFLALGYGRGLLAALTSVLIYPTPEQLGFQNGHEYYGFFGWANPLRYAGAVTLIILLPAVIRRCPARRGLAGAAGLGLFWGALSYVAQENLIAGAVGALVVGVLLTLSGTSAGRAVAGALLAVAAGFLVVWLPILGYYAANGVLGRFIQLYFLMPEAVADGYSNTPFGGPRHAPSEWATMFHVLPFVLAVLLLASVLQFRPFRVAVAWSRERTLLVAMVITTVLLYQGALLRSDNAHLTSTLLVVPALAVVVASALPRALGLTGRRLLVAAGFVLFIASFALLPRSAYRWTTVRSVAEAPYLVRQRLAAEASPAAPTTVAGQRVGGALVNETACCQASTLPMRDFIRLMNRIHEIIGDRVTYVVHFPAGYPGIVYFVADLNPAPIPEDPYTMVLTKPQLRSFLATFSRSVAPRTQALVTSDLSGGMARAFLARYPHSRLFTLNYGRPYYVLIRR